MNKGSVPFYKVPFYKAPWEKVEKYLRSEVYNFAPGAASAPAGGTAPQFAKDLEVPSFMF